MSSLQLDDTEDYDFDDFEGEDYDDESDFDDVRADARRRARLRARREAAYRARARRSRPRRGTSTVVRSPRPRQGVSDEALRQAVVDSNRLAKRATQSALASVAVSQGLDTFGAALKDRSIVRALLRFAPLALLSPARPQPGIAGIARHPAVIGGAAIAGIVAVGELAERRTGVQQIQIAPTKLSLGTPSGTFSAMATDRTGAPVPDKPTWTPIGTTFLTVRANGTYTANAQGGDWVTVKVGGRTTSTFVEIGP